jgi:hypothetical protein
MIEDFCGVPQDCSERETDAGTAYRICKWTCPGCGKECSNLEIDGEWCHGDSLCISFHNGARSVGCNACWLDAERRAKALDEMAESSRELGYDT